MLSLPPVEDGSALVFMNASEAVYREIVESREDLSLIGDKPRIHQQDSSLPACTVMLLRRLPTYRHCLHRQHVDFRVIVVPASLGDVLILLSVTELSQPAVPRRK